VVGNIHAGGGGERELGGDGAAVEVFERHRRDRLLLRHGRGRRGGRRVPPVAVDGQLRFLLLLRRAPDRSLVRGVQRASRRRVCVTVCPVLAGLN
jgi:hypothetical protein